MGTQVTVRTLLGPVVTLATLLLIEALTLAGLNIPNPPAIYYLAIVFATLAGNAFGGGLSVVITIVFLAIFYSTPGQLFQYAADDQARLVVVCVSSPLLVAMISVWKRSHETFSIRQRMHLEGQLSQMAKLEAALGHLAAVVEWSDDAIYSKDLSGRIMSWNRAAEKLYGYPAREAVGRRGDFFIPQERKAEMQSILLKVMTGSPVDHVVTERLHRDGTRLRVSLTVSPIRNPQGNVIAASTIARRV